MSLHPGIRPHMEIFVNGAPRRYDHEVTIATLLAELGCAGRRVAVEVNRDIVPRSGYAERRVQPGDRVEIVQAIGGG
jgi:sulfur carrier protein